MADVNLTQQEIDYIARVVDTEVPSHLARTNPAEYERMVQGVVDTVTNRMQSPSFPNTALGVLDQNRQFSKISGPSRLSPYGSAKNAPKASPLAQNAVYDYVAARAQGAPPTVGGALNYANPNFSDRSNLTGWIEPMIERGATALGIGRNIHQHGTVPGMDPAGYYTVAAEGMPSGAIPTPTPRDQIPSAYGIMAAIDPPTPMTVERGLLGPVTEPAPAQSAFQNASIEKSARTAEPQGFDPGRFGPAPSAFKETPVATFAPAEAPPSFDMGRFGPEVSTPATAAFDAERFGPAVTSPTPANPSVAGLQRGLLDQALAMGHLPNTPMAAAPGALLGQPAIDPMQTAAPATPGYVDPSISAQPSRQPAQSQPTYSAAPAQPAQSAVSAAQQTFNERSALGAPAHSALGPQMARDVQRDMGRRNMFGGIGGALLGGALLGPVGGLLGGMMGRNYAQRTYSPPAPEPVKGQPQQNFSRGESSYGSLNDYGRDAYSSSGDFRDAVDSGSAGLW